MSKFIKNIGLFLVLLVLIIPLLLFKILGASMRFVFKDEWQNKDKDSNSLLKPQKAHADVSSGDGGGDGGNDKDSDGHDQGGY